MTADAAHRDTFETAPLPAPFSMAAVRAASSPSAPSTPHANVTHSPSATPGSVLDLAFFLADLATHPSYTVRLLGAHRLSFGALWFAVARSSNLRRRARAEAQIPTPPADRLIVFPPSAGHRHVGQFALAWAGTPASVATLFTAPRSAAALLAATLGGTMGTVVGAWKLPPDPAAPDASAAWWVYSHTTTATTLQGTLIQPDGDRVVFSEDDARAQALIHLRAYGTGAAPVHVYAPFAWKCAPDAAAPTGPNPFADADPTPLADLVDHLHPAPPWWRAISDSLDNATVPSTEPLRIDFSSLWSRLRPFALSGLILSAAWIWGGDSLRLWWSSRHAATAQAAPSTPTAIQPTLQPWLQQPRPSAAIAACYAALARAYRDVVGWTATALRCDALDATTPPTTARVSYDRTPAAGRTDALVTALAPIPVDIKAGARTAEVVLPIAAPPPRNDDALLLPAQDAYLRLLALADDYAVPVTAQIGPPDRFAPGSTPVLFTLTSPLPADSWGPLLDALPGVVVNALAEVPTPAIAVPPTGGYALVSTSPLSWAITGLIHAASR